MIFSEGFDTAKAIEMPFEGLRGKLRLRPTEVSLLTGINGHGKSEFASQLCLDAVDQGYKVALASMEWAKEMCFYRMMRQASGMIQDTISKEYRQYIYDYYNEHLILFGVTGTQKFDALLEQMTFLRKKYGVDFFVIDNLAKLGIDEDDYNGQKHVIDALGDFANYHKCHNMLLLHPKKVDDENTNVGKMQIKGTGALTDMCKTAMSIKRNKDKEYANKKKEAGYELTAKEQKNLEGPDAILNCFKQNGGEWEGSFYMSFDKNSHQFMDYNRRHPKTYVPYSNITAIDGGKK